MLLLLDWWEGYIAAFGEYDMGRLVESLLQVLREGSAVGLRAVVTTDRRRCSARSAPCSPTG